MSSTVTILLSAVGTVFLLLVLAFLSFTAYLFYVHWKYSHIPQPKRPSFYFGHLPDMFRAQREAKNDEVWPIPTWQQWLHQVDGRTAVVFFMHIPFVFTTDPENIKSIVMRADIGKDKHFFCDKLSCVMGQRFLGYALLTVPDYETWKPKRQLYDPSFRKNYLKTLIKPFNEMADIFLDKIKPLPNGATAVPMKQHFGEYTLNVISKVAFGIEPTETWSEEFLGLKRVKSNGTLMFLVGHAFKGVNKHTFFTWYQYLHPFEAEGYREVMRAVRSVGKDCIKKRIQMVESGQQVPNDILTQILQKACKCFNMGHPTEATSEGVNIEELVDDFVTFYVAGQETTSSLMSFALILTLQHPHVLERLETEVSEVLGDKKHVTIEDLEKLQYTEQILKETLRLYAGAFGITKSSPPNGVTLDEYYIPRDTSITLFFGLMCRDPQYFDDPDTFNPSRFDPENKKPDTFVYFPFGLGHRSCIGKHFAMMEAKILLSRLFQTYKVTLPENYKLVPIQRFTIQVKGDIPCSVQLKN